jgi:hypothetical protein
VSFENRDQLGQKRHRAFAANAVSALQTSISLCYASSRSRSG